MTTTVPRIPREERLAARWKIIQAANNYGRKRASRLTVEYLPRMRGMRQIEQCVCIVRRRGLVPDDVLVAAGYNPRRSTR